MQVISEALTKVEMLSPKSKGQCRKSTILSFKYFSNSPPHQLHSSPQAVNTVQAFSLGTISQLTNSHQSFALLLTTVTTLKSRFQTTPPKSSSTLWKMFIQGWWSPIMPNCSLWQPTPRILQIFREQNPLTMHLQAHCMFLPKLHQRQKGIVFKTRMAKTHMKELRTLQTLKW